MQKNLPLNLDIWVPWLLKSFVIGTTFSLVASPSLEFFILTKMHFCFCNLFWAFCSSPKMKSFKHSKKNLHFIRKQHRFHKTSMIYYSFSIYLEIKILAEYFFFFHVGKKNFFIHDKDQMIRIHINNTTN